MFFKVSVVLAVMAVGAMSAVMEYPPGVDPMLCPNYPYCNMEMMEKGISPYRYYYSYPHYPSYPYVRYFAALPEFPKHTEVKVSGDDIAKEAVLALAPALAPAEEEAPAPAAKALEYPADVDPKDCPNYPFCQ